MSRDPPPLPVSLPPDAHAPPAPDPFGVRAHATYQGIEFLERLLDALAAQEFELPWDVHIIDSGSTDGTVEMLERYRAKFPVPFHVVRIPSVEFDHGDTRNQLAARSGGDLLVYSTQDAIPSDSRWLALLAKNFDDPEVGAAYSRNVPRADAKLLTKIMSRTDPGSIEVKDGTAHFCRHSAPPHVRQRTCRGSSRNCASSPGRASSARDCRACAS